MAGETVDTYFLLAVAGQTLAHVQSFHLSGFSHRLDLAMAGLALDTGSNMGPVLKKHKIRERGDFDPLDRLFLIPMTLEFLNFGLVRCRNLMTAHAALNRWDPGHSGAPGITVAILAGDLKIARVDLMAERNGLPRRIRPAGYGN